METSIKKQFFQYLIAGIGSSLISSIYAMVDAIMVGQYEGPSGSAALAVIAPIWSIFFSLGLLFGVGGAVLMSKERGANHLKEGNRFFTLSFIGTSISALLSLCIVLFFQRPLLILFGADETLIPLAEKYMKWVRWVCPLFTFTQFLAAFIRNDQAPKRAMAAIIAGGVFNMVGDYVFVFVFNMGIEGAGLATALGQLLATIILCCHFFSKKNQLYFTWNGKKSDFWLIIRNGFSLFVIDLAMGINALIFNNQIMHYFGSDALAVYGVIINLVMFVQCVAYGIGQAAQPLISVNYGAGNRQNILKLCRYGYLTAAVLGIVLSVIIEIIPLQLTALFMKITPQIEQIAPAIIRIYAISFLILPMNVFANYYFQSILKARTSLLVSLIRGIVLSSAFVLLLPLIHVSLLWIAVFLSELITWIVIVRLTRNYNHELKKDIL